MRKLFLLISVLFLAMMANAVVPGEKALRTAYNSAEAGSTIVLEAGTYEETERIEFTKSMTIMAAKGAEVIVKTYKDNPLTAGAEVKFIGIQFDGSEMGTREYFIRSYDATAGNELHFENCEVYNFPSATYLINAASNERSLDSIIINNCYFHNNSNDAIYVNGAAASKGIIITNSTFANSSASHSIIEVRNGGSDPTEDIELTVDHCTFYNNTYGDGDYTNIRAYKLVKAYISNCIFAHPETSAKYAVYNYGGTISNCLSYNLAGYRNWSPCPTLTNNITADPLFNDLSNNKYTFAGNWVTMNLSPARGAATDGSDLGDPRWYSAEVLPSTDFASSYVLAGNKAKLIGHVATDASNYLQFSNSSDASQHGVAIWKVRATRSCYLQATLNIDADNTSGHRYQIEVFDSSNALVGTAIGESANSWDKGDKVISDLIMLSEAGDYKIKLSNLCDNSSNLLHSITLSYYGGAVQDISTSANTTLNVADAWFSGCTRDNDKTYIQYPSSSTSDAWIKWNIATSETKYYDLTVNVNTEYNHGFTAAIYEDEDADPVASVTEGSFVETKGVLALEIGRVNLVGGKNYVVKVTNAPSGSQAKVTSVVFAPVVATATELPNTLAFSNAVLSEKANITDGMLYFNEPGADKDPRGEWAQWEVTTDHNGLFLFTMCVTSENEQSYKITIKDDGNNEIDFYESSPGSGDKTLTHYFALSAGNYFVKVENTRSFSKGHLVSFEVTEPDDVVTLNEATDNNTSWASLVGNENTYDVQIIRTIKAGMYNTFCLPFAVSSSQCKDIFGSDVLLLNLFEATVDENSVLTLDFKTASDIYPGTPVLIQTSRDIVNPVFTGVKFEAATPSATTKTNANFTGTFIKTSLEANENILFLGANNKLYFPTKSVDMYGMRGWFVIHDVPAGAIKRARIVENNNAPTDIEIIGSQKAKANGQKLIENGQLIIVRDGIRYNVMGARVK